MRQLFRNNSIIYVCTSEVQHMIVGRYKTDVTGQILISFEVNNADAVKQICSNKDLKPVTEQELTTQLTAILRDVVKVARANGVNVDKILSEKA